MYKYEFKIINGMKVEFKSNSHISMLSPICIKGATFVTFPDTGHTINLGHTKELKIDGVKYQLRPYTVI